jgi:hypothetical protein
MKVFRLRSLALAAAGVLAASALVPSASAQPKCKGTFTLNDEITWQGRSLPSGNYTFELNSLPGWQNQLELRGPNGAVILLSNSVARQQNGEQSFIAIERRNGTDFVRQLYLAPLGVHFYYSVPKAQREGLLAQNSTRLIPISTTGK